MKLTQSMIPSPRRVALIALCVTALAAPFSLRQAAAVTAAGGDEFAIVVSPKNEYNGEEAAAKKVVKQLYLKERTDWPSGVEATPFSRKDGSSEQEAFLKTVLGMSDGAIADHWSSVKQKRGETPPRAASTSAMMLKLLDKYEGAFGVMPLDEAEAAGEKARILFKFSGD